MSRPIIAVAAVVVLFIGSDRASAERQAENPGAAVRRAMAAQGPVVAPADRATLNAKCGLPQGAELRNIYFTDGALHCPDGRQVRDDETRAIGERISIRARAQARAALASPDVRAAIARYGDEQQRAALRRLAEVRD